MRIYFHKIIFFNLNTTLYVKAYNIHFDYRYSSFECCRFIGTSRMYQGISVWIYGMSMSHRIFYRSLCLQPTHTHTNIIGRPSHHQVCQSQMFTPFIFRQTFGSLIHLAPRKLNIGSQI